MKPDSTPSSADDLFRSQLKTILDCSHPLIRLADKIDWAQVDQRVAPLYADEGRPGLSPRLMVGLHYLKHAFDESDESVCDRWVENPYWQYFCGEVYLQHELPIDPSSMTRWRDRVGSELFNDLLHLTLRLAVGLNQAKPREFEEVAVDTTVQEKAIAHPTDAKLYNTARQKLVSAARDHKIPIRQSYARKGPEALRMHGRYCHAKQFRRAKRQRKKLHNYLGRLIRDIERGLRRGDDLVLDERAETLLDMARRLYRQQPQSKDKLYSLHAPEVICISKGKAHKRYEFGCKVGLVTSLRGNWVLSSMAFYENVYDGHTMGVNIANAVCNSGKRIKLASVDKGYRGHNADWLVETVLIPGQRGNRGRAKQGGKLPRSLRKKLKRRNAIEPVIGHMKHDHRMDRCHLKGSQGNRINALGAAMGFNFRKLLAGLKAAPACAVCVAFWARVMAAESSNDAYQRGLARSATA